ncbi:hypothetical protein RJ640_005460 [Escallonia rubra]|uniref:Uncharacterized protein n=1 Tax=Escallonia rubra TaxID=112253 RepID=A0AA88RJF5_9ASTE|nr:hypothetical protein RJ640_005460 [Escallonia rubra]
MILRGQGDSPVRVCEPCKKLEEAARFEMRHGHKNKAGKGTLNQTSKFEDEVLNKILGKSGNESVSSGQESAINMKRGSSSASYSNSTVVTSETDGAEILRSFSLDAPTSVEAGSTTPEGLRQQALDEKQKYKILKAEGKSDEALRAFKRGKELERQAGALELQLRKSRKRALSSSKMNGMEKIKDEPRDGSRRSEHSSHASRDKDDLAAELKQLGWSDMDLHSTDKKPASMSLEGELSSLLGEDSQRTHGIDKSQVIAHKKKAVTLKREGKLVEAKEELKKAKILEKQIEEQEFLADAEYSDDELSSLIRSMDVDKHDDVSIGNQHHVNLNFGHLMEIDDGIGLESKLEVTEDDMDDPELAAALQSLGWTEEHDHPEDIQPQFAPVDKEALLSEIQSLKREAVNQKRAGNTAEAMALLKKAKLLQGELESCDSQGTNLMSHSSSVAQKGSVSNSAEKSLKPDQVDVNGTEDVHPKLAPKSKLVIQRELLGLKKRALALRREGRINEADEELKKGKVLEQQLADMDDTSKVKVIRSNVSNKVVDTSSVPDVGDEEEAVTDQDMHDPSYLLLLQNLGWKEESKENVESPPKESYNTSVQTSESSTVQGQNSSKVGASKRTKGEIQRELLGLKRKSLALRRQGEADEAEEVLKMAKLLETQLEEMEATKQEVPVEFSRPKKEVVVNSSMKNAADGGDGADFSEAAIPVEPQKGPTEGMGSGDLVRHGKSEVVRASFEQHIVEADSPSIMASKSNPSSPEQEIMAHRRKALTLKRAGKLTEAKDELRQAKILEKSLEDQPTEPSTSSNDVLSSSVATSSAPSSAPKMSSRDRFKLQQESLGHKRQALKLRREGRTQEAEAEFELAKALETQLEELATHDPMKLSAEPVDVVGVEDLLDPQLLSALRAIGIEGASVASRGPERPEPSRPVAVTNESPSSRRNQLEERIKAEKVKAVNFKRSGQQAEALDALRRAKMLEKELKSFTP